MKDVITDNYKLLHGDCLERMKETPDGSVDLILTDPPYQTTNLSWDSIIPLDEMWFESYRDWVVKQPQLLKDLHELRGKTLGCFCKPKRCHGDVLVELVNGLGE